METFNRKAHWENIYQTRQLKEVSWYEPLPLNSLEMIEKAAASKDSKIIDVGGGDSLLVDNLLENGFTDVTVLDISESAIERAKKRLGSKAASVKWIISDASDFDPGEKYDVWHDRAAFHFLTNEEEIESYRNSAIAGTNPGATLIIGTFSEQGPLKCSGIEIKQYSEDKMREAFKESFEKTDCKRIDHHTPFNTTQNFVFCTFRKKTQNT